MWPVLGRRPCFREAWLCRISQPAVFLLLRSSRALDVTRLSHGATPDDGVNAGGCPFSFRSSPLTKGERSHPSCSPFSCGPTPGLSPLILWSFPHQMKKLARRQQQQQQDQQNTQRLSSGKLFPASPHCSSGLSYLRSSTEAL